MPKIGKIVRAVFEKNDTSIKKERNYGDDLIGPFPCGGPKWDVDRRFFWLYIHVTCLQLHWFFKIFYEKFYDLYEKMDPDLHEEALQRLCFVCGDIITKGKLYDVDFYREMLCKGLKCDTVCSVPGITPSSFCAKCYSTVQSVATGKATRTGRTLIEWVVQSICARKHRDPGKNYNTRFFTFTVFLDPSGSQKKKSTKIDRRDFS